MPVGAGGALVPIAAGLALPVVLGGGALVTAAGGVLTGLSIARKVGTTVKVGRAAAEVVDQVGKARRSSSRPEAPAAPPQAGGRPSFDAEQRANMAIIASEVAGAALPQVLAASRPALTVAMVVNAWHESRLRADATNLSGRDSSYGLFQVNRQGALGRPHAPELLMVPAYNTRVILTEVWNRSGELETVARHGTIADLTAAFTAHVERPSDRFATGRQRAATAIAWFGSVALQKAYRWAA